MIYTCFWESLESPLDCKIKPVSSKENQPWIFSERLMLKLKVQYLGHLFQRADSLEKTLMLGKIEGKRRRGGRGWDGWMAALTQWTWVWANARRWWRIGKPGVLQSMGSQRVSPDLGQQQSAGRERCGAQVAAGDGMTWIALQETLHFTGKYRE